MAATIEQVLAEVCKGDMGAAQDRLAELEICGGGEMVRKARKLAFPERYSTGNADPNPMKLPEGKPGETLYDRAKAA